nr:pyridoxamine 5'-phosphate oxidase family protein [Galbitalea soli]
MPDNDDPDRPQITLSTVTADGGADARTVLMSEFDEDGFYFHTDAHSRKAADIAANPLVAITVLWPGFTRQLVIRGAAEPAAPREVAAAYEKRSPYLQQLAWQNSVEFAQLPIDERRRAWASFTEAHPDGFRQPANWAGYLVRPFRLTFWTSNPDTASHRVEYVRDGEAWSVQHLAG